MLMCNIVASDYFEDPSHSIFLNDQSTPYFKELCERAHALGSKVCAQLHPGNGRIGGPSLRYPVPISASACPWMHAPQVMCHELSVDEIHKLEDDYPRRRAARRRRRLRRHRDSRLRRLPHRPVPHRALE